MYLNFFGFTKKPFHITPDPEFLYLSPSHKEALGSIIYGIEQRMGFVAITGEVGTGKTTIIRSYLEDIDRTEVLPVYIFNANVTFRELLLTIFEEMGLNPEKESEREMVKQLSLHLIERYKQNQNVVLIVDEAQAMPVETMEQLRLLSNLETTTEKLLQIVLVGQPELEDKFNLQELRQLRQRIAIKTTIRHLSQQECVEYVLHRISKVAKEGATIFHKDALALLVKSSEGTPRILNTLCENALIAAYAYQEREVNEKVVKEVLQDYFGSKSPAAPPAAAKKAGVGIPGQPGHFSLKTIIVLIVLMIMLLGSIVFMFFSYGKIVQGDSPGVHRRQSVLLGQVSEPDTVQSYVSVRVPGAVGPS